MLFFFVVCTSLIFSPSFTQSSSEVLLASDSSTEITLSFEKSLSDSIVIFFESDPNNNGFLDMRLSGSQESAQIVPGGWVLVPDASCTSCDFNVSLRTFKSPLSGQLKAVVNAFDAVSGCFKTDETNQIHGVSTLPQGNSGSACYLLEVCGGEYTSGTGCESDGPQGNLVIMAQSAGTTVQICVFGFIVDEIEVGSETITSSAKLTLQCGESMISLTSKTRSEVLSSSSGEFYIVYVKSSTPGSTGFELSYTDSVDTVPELTLGSSMVVVPESLSLLKVTNDYSLAFQVYISSNEPFSASLIECSVSSKCVIDSQLTSGGSYSTRASASNVYEALLTLDGCEGSETACDTYISFSLSTPALVSITEANGGANKLFPIETSSDGEPVFSVEYSDGLSSNSDAFRSWSFGVPLVAQTGLSSFSEEFYADLAEGETYYFQISPYSSEMVVSAFYFDSDSSVELSPSQDAPNFSKSFYSGFTVGSQNSRLLISIDCALSDASGDRNPSFCPWFRVALWKKTGTLNSQIPTRSLIAFPNKRYEGFLLDMRFTTSSLGYAVSEHQYFFRIDQKYSVQVTPIYGEVLLEVSSGKKQETVLYSTTTTRVFEIQAGEVLTVSINSDGPDYGTASYWLELIGPDDFQVEIPIGLTQTSLSLDGYQSASFYIWAPSVNGVSLKLSASFADSLSFSYSTTSTSTGFLSNPCSDSELEGVVAVSKTTTEIATESIGGFICFIVQNESATNGLVYSFSLTENETGFLRNMEGFVLGSGTETQSFLFYVPLYGEEGVIQLTPVSSNAFLSIEVSVTHQGTGSELASGSLVYHSEQNILLPWEFSSTSTSVEATHALVSITLTNSQEKDEATWLYATLDSRIVYSMEKSEKVSLASSSSYSFILSTFGRPGQMRILSLASMDYAVSFMALETKYSQSSSDDASLVLFITESFEEETVSGNLQNIFWESGPGFEYISVSLVTFSTPIFVDIAFLPAFESLHFLSLPFYRYTTCIIAGESSFNVPVSSLYTNTSGQFYWDDHGIHGEVSVDGVAVLNSESFSGVDVEQWNSSSQVEFINEGKGELFSFKVVGGLNVLELNMPNHVEIREGSNDLAIAPISSLLGEDWVLSYLAFKFKPNGNLTDLPNDSLYSIRIGLGSDGNLFNENSIPEYNMIRIIQADLSEPLANSDGTIPIQVQSTVSGSFNIIPVLPLSPLLVYGASVEVSVPTFAILSYAQPVAFYLRNVNSEVWINVLATISYLPMASISQGTPIPEVDVVSKEADVITKTDFNVVALGDEQMVLEILLPPYATREILLALPISATTDLIISCGTTTNLTATNLYLAQKETFVTYSMMETAISPVTNGGNNFLRVYPCFGNFTVDIYKNQGDFFEGVIYASKDIDAKMSSVELNYPLKDGMIRARTDDSRVAFALYLFQNLGYPDIVTSEMNQDYTVLTFGSNFNILNEIGLYAIYSFAVASDSSSAATELFCPSQYNTTNSDGSFRHTKVSQFIVNSGIVPSSVILGAVTICNSETCEAEIWLENLEFVQSVVFYGEIFNGATGELVYLTNSVTFEREPQKKSSLVLFLIIGAGVLLILGVLFGVYYFRKKKEKEERIQYKEKEFDRFD